MPALLDKLQGKELCISLLLDPRYRHWDTALSSTTIPSELPDNAQLKSTIAAFMESLKISTEKAREIEQDTREHHLSSLWFAVRHYRITASLFGDVLQRRQDTPPDNLVLRILQEKQFMSAATEWRYRITASLFGDVLQRRQDTPPDNLVLRILQEKQFTSAATEWRYRITASLFGDVLQRRQDTPPDNLVLRILQEKQFTSAATEWRYRITASLFGDVLQRRQDTPPDNLVLRILQEKQFTSAATEWRYRITASLFGDVLQRRQDTPPDNLVLRILQEKQFTSAATEWRYRITASLFGDVLQRRQDTPPDNLVLRILQEKQFTSAATEWGRQKESVACQEYVAYQPSHGHLDLVVTPSGFIISEAQPFLGASPDGSVYDHSNHSQPLGFLEIKCPYAQRNVTPVDSCLASGLCYTAANGKQTLRRNHRYFAQIQGQMAVGKRPWCDFVIYTTHGLGMQRIPFDQKYWEKILLLNLQPFIKIVLLLRLLVPFMYLLFQCIIYQKYNY